MKTTTRTKKAKRRVPADRLKKLASGDETLERLKRWPGLARHIMLPVYIYSGEHRAYWARERAGYVPTIYGAGSWDIDVALKLTRHCGPEKLITFQTLF